ncbi:MAG: signal recognition particle-docking protein FtsY [Actinobacteria bacterium]|nr:signal recognition particle-docking protein FtsY [Actinomycetota bacterium]
MLALEVFALQLAADLAPKILLALTVLTVVFGVGVVVFGRRRDARVDLARDDFARDDLAKVATEPDVEVTPDVATPVIAPPATEKVNATATVRDRLGKVRSSFAGALSTALTRSAITAETWDGLEEALLRADLGVATTTRVLAPLRELVKAKKIIQPNELRAALQTEMTAQLSNAARELNFDRSLNAPNIWLVVGVNGAGKTTTIGKLSAQQRKLGRTVLMAAGDTFRAAAGDQLETWAQRSGAEIVRGSEGGDPSSVVFDGVARATAKKIDLVLADTAGRLQNNANLMEELTKVRRVADKGSGKVTEVLLVIDATTGQNGLTQAKQFAQATAVTGVVLTKLDGSARGGIVFAIETELQIPVKLVGLGETIDDLVEFDAAEFVAALFV